MLHDRHKLERLVKNLTDLSTENIWIILPFITTQGLITEDEKIKMITCLKRKFRANDLTSNKIGKYNLILIEYSRSLFSIDFTIIEN